jgi:NAD(P)-dependent dehydrogenase (short-subunit alcohol dehydrogenase family)
MKSAISPLTKHPAQVSLYPTPWKPCDQKSRRVRVNAISAGPTDTPGLSELFASLEVAQHRTETISTAVPLGRFGTPDEIAKAVRLLPSDDAKYITGVELFVDGGIAQV